MKDIERSAKARELLIHLEMIERDIVKVAEPNQTEQKLSDAFSALRLRLAAVEHQAALLRLLQAEDRLRQAVWKIAAGALGVVFGLLVRPLIG